MPERPAPDGEYVEEELDEGRCPECGNEDGNTRHDERGNIQPIPPEMKGECGECGHRDHPLAFAREYEWARLSEEEKEERRQKAAEYRDEMAAYQESAHHLSLKREP